jgi:hypothetical protein
MRLDVGSTSCFHKQLNGTEALSNSVGPQDIVDVDVDVCCCCRCTKILSCIRYHVVGGLEDPVTFATLTLVFMGF